MTNSASLRTLPNQTPSYQFSICESNESKLEAKAFAQRVAQGATSQLASQPIDRKQRRFAIVARTNGAIVACATLAETTNQRSLHQHFLRFELPEEAMENKGFELQNAVIDPAHRGNGFLVFSRLFAFAISICEAENADHLVCFAPRNLHHYSRYFDRSTILPIAAVELSDNDVPFHDACFGAASMSRISGHYFNLSKRNLWSIPAVWSEITKWIPTTLSAT